MLRRLRAVALTAITWALVWLPISLGMGVYRYSRIQRDVAHGILDSGLGALKVISFVALIWSAWAAFSGALFAIILSLAERRRTLAQLSTLRIVAWGAIGTMALPGILLAILILYEPGFYLVAPTVLTLSISGVLGGLCSAGTLLLAKRAPLAPAA